MYMYMYMYTAAHLYNYMKTKLLSLDIIKYMYTSG